MSRDFSALYEQQQALNEHRVFSLIRSRQTLATFMSWHVFAVWDFMSLVKRLQYELTGRYLLWLPPSNTEAAGLINEIVLGEESDKLPDGRYASHYEMYLTAMHEVGADSQCVRRFVELLGRRVPPGKALNNCCISEPVRTFVKGNIDTALYGSIYQVLGSFFFARESVIPQMFQDLLNQWGLSQLEAPMFVYYLKRHIELDSESHAPAALRIIDTLVGGDDRALEQLISSAEHAIDQRKKLWDALADTLENASQAEDAA